MYGRFRMFGGIGFGTMAFIIGKLMDIFGYAAMFISYCLALSCFIFCVRYEPFV